MLGKKITSLWAGFVLIFVVVSASAKDEESGVAGERFMDFHAIHRQTKEPLADVTLEIQIHGQDRQNQKLWGEKTNSQGQCKIQLPDFEIRTLRIYPQKEGFVPLRIFWSGDPTPPEIPKTYTLAIEPGKTIGGTIRNEQDQPIKDVVVSIYYIKDDPKAAENARVNVSLYKVKTDDAGRWKFDRMPAEIDKNELRIFLTHPDYLSDDLRPGHIPLPISRQPPIEKLRDLSAVMVMKKGLTVSGKVTDKRGKPIIGARIYDTEDYWWRSTKPFAETDAQGQFQSNANPGTVTWSVQAPGYAPDLRVVTIKEGMLPVEFRLEPGHVIEGNVTDQAGKPVEGASVSAEDWRGNRRRLHLVAKTDAEGNFKITDAPADEVTFDIGKQGYMILEKYPMKPGKDKYNITLRSTLKVRGAVLDAQTGQPIKKFTVTNGFDHEDGRAPQWDKLSVRTFTDGRYEIEYRQEIFTYRLRVDAEGYQSAISDRIRPSEISKSDVDLDFKLDKATTLAGTILASDGAPLSGIDVVIATHWLQITNGAYDSRSSEENRILKTDVDGKFHFEPPVSPYVIVVLDEQGFAKVASDDFKMSPTITLSPWGHIEGTLRIGAQTGADKLMAFLHQSRSEMEQPRIYLHYETRTDANGHFAFTKVFPGEGVVTRAIPMGNQGRRFSHSVSVEVESGKTANVTIGGTGRPVIGKVVIPDLLKNTFDWEHTNHGLRISSPNSPYRIMALNFDKDGSFRTDDVPAGDYAIYVTAYGPPPNSRTYRGERIGILSRAFTIPEMPDGRSDEPLNLGELTLEAIGKSALMPSLLGKPLPDLGEIKLSSPLGQTSDKMILVCFWDMNQRPSRRCISQLAEKVTELKEKNIIVIAIQASKMDHDALDGWVKKNTIPFPVGMVQDKGEKTRFTWGVKSLPWLILTNRSYVVRAEGFGLDNLDTMIKER